MAHSAPTEYTALLRLLRLATGTREAGPDPLPPFSPGRLARLARHHGVLPLAARGLKRAYPEPSVAEALREMTPVLGAAARNSLLLSAELLALVEFLGTRGVQVLPYKGPLLAVLLYGSPEMRICRDLDLLFPRDQVLEAAALLEERGYRPVSPLLPEQMRALLETGYHHQVSRESDGVFLELHWRVANGYFATLDEPGLWRRRTEARFLGRTLPSLALEDLTLCLAVHGARHHWDRLSHVVDFAALVERIPEDRWPEVLELARESGTRRRLTLALRLAERLMESGPARQALARLPQDRGAAELAERLARRLEDDPVEPYRLLQHARVDLAGMDCLQDRFRYFRGALAPNVPDWTDPALPRALVPLAPLLRPLRLLRSHGLFESRTRRE